MRNGGVKWNLNLFEGFERVERMEQRLLLLEKCLFETPWKNTFLIIIMITDSRNNNKS